MGIVIKADLVGRRKPESDVYVVQPDVQLDEMRAPVLTPEQIAAETIRNAEEAALGIIAQAEHQRDSIRVGAHAEGYAAGFRELEAERAVAEARLRELEENAEKCLDDYYNAMEPEILKLSVEIAGQVVKQHIETDEEFVLKTIKAGLRQLRERNEIRIRVNPVDYEFTRTHKDEISQSCDGVRSIEVTDDRRVAQGGCIIESPNGELDARIETQLAEIERALREAAHDGRNQTGSHTG